MTIDRSAVVAVEIDLGVVLADIVYHFRPIVFRAWALYLVPGYFLFLV
jgi:hypothetical protein